MMALGGAVAAAEEERDVERPPPPPPRLEHHPRPDLLRDRTRDGFSGESQMYEREGAAGANDEEVRDLCRGLGGTLGFALIAHAPKHPRGLT